MARLETKVYDSAIFFDNSMDHIMHFTYNTTAKSVCVGETMSDDVLIPFDSREYVDFLAKNGLTENINDKIAKLINNDKKYDYVLRRDRGYVAYDPKSGIKQLHTDILFRWLDSIPAEKNKVALFDWDRTITVFEGMVLPIHDIRPAEEFNDEKLNASWINYLNKRYGPEFEEMADYLREHPTSIEELLLYLCGGSERLAMLRSIFRRCMETKTDIIVLTNNAGCTSKHYKEIVKRLIGSDIPHEIICSSGEPYFGNKSKLVDVDERFYGLKKIHRENAYEGGSHKRHTRRQKRRARVTRRRRNQRKH